MEKKITVYALKVNDDGMPCKGFLTEIDDTLKAIQGFVGGWFQPVGLKPGIIIVCNDDGKLKRLPPNRAFMVNGRVADVFVGDIFVCRTDGKEFASILETDIALIEETLRPIDLIIGNEVLCCPAETLPDYAE